MIHVIFYALLVATIIIFWIRDGDKKRDIKVLNNLIDDYMASDRRSHMKIMLFKGCMAEIAAKIDALKNEVDK